ncbi:MAG: SurA N-terminal domain-containing protein, partial [Pacificimonas sp.]
MISFFRRALKSPIVIGLFALVIVAFIVTGVGDPLGGGVATDTLAKVGETEIDDRRVSNQFDRTLQLVRQENPDMTTEQAVDEGLVRITLDRLIGATALSEFADKMGLGSSKRLVDAEIARVPAFAGPAGGFDEQTYRQVLQRENLNEQALRLDIEGDVKRRQLLSLVTNISGTPDSIAEPLALLQLEQRTLQLGAVPFREMNDLPDATEEQVKSYYQENIARFTIPERRKFRFAVIDKSKLAENAKVTDAEIIEAYEDSDDLYGATKSLTLRQAVAPNQAQAVEIAKRVKAGESLAAVAADLLDYTSADLELGTVSQGELAGAVNADVASAVFAAGREGLVGPIDSDFGWHVVSIDEVITNAAKPLADVRDEIEARVKADKVEARLADLVGEAQDGFADGASLTEVAERLKLDIVDAPPLTQAGLTPDDPEFRLDPALQSLVT